MQRLLALDEVRPADLWREVPPSEDEFWCDAQERQRRLLKVLLEGALEEELTQVLGAGRFRRTDNRQGYRNGFYARDLTTQIGIVSGIRVPRARTATVYGCASCALRPGARRSSPEPRHARRQLLR